MINITKADAVTGVYQLCYFHAEMENPLPDVGLHLPDVKISKRPNVLPSNFIGGLGRSGRSGRLSGVSYWTGKCTCFSPYVVRIGKHVLNVRTSGNPSNHISQAPQNRKAFSL